MSVRFIHRLDYATSGCLCVALNKKAARWGHKAFSKRYVTKHYLALVCQLLMLYSVFCSDIKKGKGTAYSIVKRRVPGLIPVLGSQPAGGVSHKPSGRLPLLSTRHSVTLATLKRAAAIFAAW